MKTFWQSFTTITLLHENFLFQQISIFRPKCTWLTEGIFLSVQMETVCEHKSPESGGEPGGALRKPKASTAGTPRAPQTPQAGLGLTKVVCSGAEQPIWSFQAWRVAPATWSVLPDDWTWHTCAHNCLFSWKEDVPAAEQCVCDHSCNLVRIQPNGQILWNDYAQQIFCWCECRYGSMRSIEGQRW